jgi:hypothetical protein
MKPSDLTNKDLEINIHEEIYLSCLEEDKLDSKTEIE